MHIKQDIKFAKFAQFVKENCSCKRGENIQIVLFQDLEESELITFPDGKYYKCAGKTLGELTQNATPEEIVECLDAYYGVETITPEALGDFRALIVEIGQCACGGDLYYTGITALGSEPFLHRCLHCGRERYEDNIVEIGFTS